MFMPRTSALVVLSMLAFAANSLLCRLALHSTRIDAASFTTVRLVSGAATLWLLLRLRARRPAGDWRSALALFVYATAFSFAYVSLPAGSGALILFGAVQTTMLGYGLYRGERLRPWQVAGLGCAVGGLVWLVLPGVAAPPLAGAAVMACAGTAWGVYSLRGRRASDAAAATAGNFLRTVPLAALLCVVFAGKLSLPPDGCGYALASAWSLRGSATSCGTPCCRASPPRRRRFSNSAFPWSQRPVAFWCWRNR